MSWQFFVLIPLLGIFCGLAGAWFALLLNAVETIAYGAITGTVAESATQALPIQRFVVVGLAGCIIAPVWYLLRKSGPNIPTVSEAMNGARMPLFWTAADTSLQVINVGIGGSIGREGAPRQFGSMGADHFAYLLGINTHERAMLIACAAGASLAGIYNVPIGGAIFTIECVWGLSCLSFRKVQSYIFIISAIIMAWISTAIAWIIVPDRPIYTTEIFDVDILMLSFAVFCSPIFGVAGFSFGTAFDALKQRAPRNTQILWMMPLCYIVLAILAYIFPLVLGNGHALALDVFAGDMSIMLAFGLVVAKPMAAFLTVWAGAIGGKLTPSLSIGAVAGLILGVGFSLFAPIPATGAALIGAAAFLAATLNGPYTACVLLIEFTALPVNNWLPIVLAVTGSYATVRLIRHYYYR